ncbi:MAG: CBS domain-containing protein [Deltaproteobacteria bacterium]
MKVRDVMTREVDAVAPDSSLKDAASKMHRLDVGFLVVYNDKQPVGVLTDRDIVIRATARGLNPSQTRVSEVMSRDVSVCFSDEPLEQAARMMEEQQVRRLVIVDHEGAMVGILSLGDMAVRGARRLACDVFERICESGNPPGNYGGG